jgi:hypothetical protein
LKNPQKTFGGFFKVDCCSLGLNKNQIQDKEGGPVVAPVLLVGFILDLIFMFLLALLLMISSSWIFGRGEIIFCNKFAI